MNKELEHLLKVIAESHWKINDANDKYVNIKNMASVEKIKEIMLKQRIC